MRPEHVPMPNISKYRAEPTKTNMIERFLLLFVKKRFEKHDLFEHITEYKVLFGRKIILRSYWLPPNHWNCRCAINRWTMKNT